jgi:hypothetical protein
LAIDAISSELLIALLALGALAFAAGGAILVLAAGRARGPGGLNRTNHCGAGQSYGDEE